MKGFKKKEWMVFGLEAALALLLIFGYKSAVTEKVGTWSGKVESSVSEKKTGIKDGNKKGQREKTGKEEKGEEGEELQEKKIAPADIITHRYPMKEMEKGFHIMRDKTEDYIKIMMVQE